MQSIANAGGTGLLDTIDDQYDDDCESFNYSEEVAPGVFEEKNICPGPVIATDEEKLRNALLGILQSIGTGRGSFSSPAVPLEQMDARDFIFVPSFVPVAKAPYWKGRLAAFKRPLQFVEDDEGRMIPDESVECTTSVTTGCFAWEAGEELLPLMPTAMDVVNGEFKVGYGAQERRVLWAHESDERAVPFDRHLLLPDPADENVRIELWGRLGIPFDPATVLTDPVPLLEASALVGDILRIRTGENRDGIDEVMGLGDIFHSSPSFVGAPGQLEYISGNLMGASSQEVCYDDNGDFNEDATGYRCFWQRQQYRRRVVYAGANDGMLHAFDAGRLSHAGADNLEEFEFHPGTGKELFAYMPSVTIRNAQERIVERANKHDWGVDGRVVSGVDVFVDAVYTLDPDPADRGVAVDGDRRHAPRGQGVLRPRRHQPRPYDHAPQ